MRASIILLALVVGCRSGGEVAEAIIASSIALTASAINRADGGCYAMCSPGTVCNEVTGTCDVLPCRGRCAMGESCEQTPNGDRCVPAVHPAVIPVGVRCEGAGCTLVPSLVVPSPTPMPHPQLPRS